MKIRRGIGICLTAAMLLGTALADPARVLTPGGPVNVRRSADSKAKVVVEAPNRSLVEVLETVGDWSRVSYKKKTGYVKNEFLLLPAALAGRTVYPDSGTLLRASPAADAAVVLPVGAWEAVSVERVENGWAYAACGEAAGWLPVEALSYQYAEPNGEVAWMREPGAIAARCSLESEPDRGEVLAVLEAGEEVTVTEITGKSCLVISAAGCGYVPISSVTLRGPADAAANMEAVALAEAALQKKYSALKAGKFYATVEPMDGDAWRVGFFNAEEQYAFGALVRAGQAVFTARYDGFAAPNHSPELLPQGQVDLRLSAESLAVGDVLDVSVQAWTRAHCAYALTRDGKAVRVSDEDGHFSAAYRPRQAGEYALKVTVSDESGRAVTVEAAFTVTEAAGAEPLSPIYSQKDGWWLDRAYRDSTLDQSGCAIFTLSHALQRMGHTGDDLAPQNLARVYALCLTPDGTNNERLIREAAAAYGFSTRSALIHDEEEIARLLREGAMFSFSIARGHIALVSGLSEDGGMVRVVDSAPGATFTRIVGDSLYRRMNSGSFRAALALDDLPGARWYLETGEYSGLEYWMRLGYAAKRGVRLIMPAVPSAGYSTSGDAAQR